MLKTVLISFTLFLAPLTVAAQGCDHERQTASCADGATWDAAKGVCVPITSS